MFPGSLYHPPGKVWGTRGRALGLEPALSFSLGLSSKVGFSATYLLCDLGQVIYLSEPQSPYLYKGTVMMPVLVPLNCPLELLGKK